jgi:hypothetical protein
MTTSKPVCFISAVLLLISSAASSAIHLNLTVPATSTGDYTVTWDGKPNNALQESVDGGSSYYTIGYPVDSMEFTNKPAGTYTYRVHWVKYRRGTYVHKYSESRTVVVSLAGPELDPPATQAAYTYDVRVGDLDNDGRQDALITRTSGDLDNGVIAEQLIQRLGDNSFALVTEADDLYLVTARAWPVEPQATVVPADFNIDGYTDIAVRGLQGANTQILVSSGVPYDGGASQVGEIDDDTRQFMDDTFAFLADPDYFDGAATADEDGYNIRIDYMVGYCYLLYGFPICLEHAFTVADFDVSLADLGLSEYLSAPSQSALSQVSQAASSAESAGQNYSPTVHAKAATQLAEQNVDDLHGYMAESATALQKLAAVMPDISNTPDVLQCVYWCGGFISYFSNSYSYVYWVDTWTPITIPGEFDHENYSIEAYEHSQALVQVLGNPAVGELAKAVLTRVGIIVGVPVVWEIIEDVIESREDGEGPIIDPWFEAWMEAILNTACVDVDDPQECMTAIEDILEEDLDPISGEVPAVGGATQVDPDEFDEDYMTKHFPILAGITAGLKNPARINCTYRKFSILRNQTYYGRTSGAPGETCATALTRRDNSRVNLKSFAPAVLDRQLTGLLGWPSIRGREQQLMDSWMLDGRVVGNVANVIRGVAKKNPLACTYHLASSAAFLPPIAPYTGDGTCP